MQNKRKTKNVYFHVTSVLTFTRNRMQGDGKFFMLIACLRVYNFFFCFHLVILYLMVNKFFSSRTHIRLGLPIDLLPSDSPTNTYEVFVFIFSSVRATCPAQLVFVDSKTSIECNRSILRCILD
jgi:CDP-diglyceride synthetase